MKLDLTRLPALVWLNGEDARINVVEIAVVATVTGYCYNTNDIYVADIITVNNTSYRIIYYDTLTDLLPEEFI